jgi:DNA-binding NtrC family response regulator
MNPNPSILIVEDDESFARRLGKNLEMDDFSVRIALGGEQALDILVNSYFDLIITDVKMPDLNGLDMIRIIRQGGRSGLDTDVPIVVLTSVNSVDTAVNAMRLGAADFITKESERPEIILRLRKVLEQNRLLNENRFLKDQLEKNNEFSEFIGESRQIKKIKSEIADLAPQDVSILLIGETGVGKELVARALHNLRPSHSGPFVDVNCAALPDDSLIQSELFGHERGAFTGAVRQRKGKFEQAGTGSLFLDEISELSSASQGKILKAIENRTITRLGGIKEIGVHCRFLFATNKDLLEEAAAGRFRRDLYYRVNVYPIHIPPLRERRQDIPFLARFFIQFFCKKYRKNLKQFDQSSLERLTSYAWPGNVRELRNIIERLVIKVHTVIITASDVESCGLSGANRRTVQIILPEGGVNLDELEKDLTRQALEIAGWHQKKAASLLGMSVDRMNSRVRKYKFTHPSWRKHRPD